MPHLGERLEHQLPRRTDEPGDDDLAVGRRGWCGSSCSGRAQQLLLLTRLLEALHVLIEPVEALVPEPFEPASPLVNRSQPAGVEAVQTLLACLAVAHKANLAED